MDQPPPYEVVSDSAGDPPIYTHAETSAALNSQRRDLASGIQALDQTTPVTYLIGRSQRTEPLVHISKVKGHLALLHAFATLRSQIDAHDVNTEYAVPLIPEDNDRRWAWFVGLAVERFSAWCEILGEQDIDSPAADFLPPLDVLMVWHAYMLNPGWYAEDCTRIPALRQLARVSPVFSSSFSHELEKILTSEPSTARLHLWCTRTSRAFDPLDDAHLHLSKDIRCPKCRRVIEAAYMNTIGTGYLQQNFFVRCPAESCRTVPKITKGVLGARKLAEDLVRQNAGARTYLAGTIRTPENSAEFTRGKLVKKLVLPHPRFSPPTRGVTDTEKWVVSILEKNNYQPENMRSAIASKMHAKSGNLIRRIFSAYTDGEKFSLDLVGAVIRQGSFIKKMHGLGWTEPHFFNNTTDEVAIHHAIARYHAFLDLLAASPAAFYVPTLDIDLVWHTHQLMGPEYNSDCKTHVGRYIDHDDKVEEGALSSAFDTTCQAWKDRFHLPYTHCGCPLPGESIGKRLSLLRAVHFQSKTLPYLDPPQHADLSATHPSDHNAVFFFHRKNAGLVAQQHRLEKHVKQQVRDGHDPAFLVPVPMYFTYPEGVVCAATPGNVVNNPNGSAIGGCAVAGACVIGGPECGAGGLCGVGGGGCRAGRWSGANSGAYPG